ncbi:Y-family DNA polymerase [Streptococcus moroccensis]|uniref:DNA polymerase V n=1 Tax=Streptococcus moroccensis TaxID=1451356 RepID=A0ABT9YSZ8_9STRE|nr:Y-family DNA polymerase [Streptococcus moroccensis]MDQ0222483.1 DNA polymerase V [Streptococcus moroccensis]
MGYIDYSLEPRSDIAFIDMKSFYASVECVARGLNPLTTSLCVMSRTDTSKGLILASSPTFKAVFGKSNVGRAYDLPFDVVTRKFNPQKARQEGIPITREYVEFIEKWAQRTFIVPPRMDEYIAQNMRIQKIFQDFASPSDILPYSIDEAFIDLTGSLNYFIPEKQLSRRQKLDLVSDQIQYKIWKETGVYATVGMSNANPLLAKLALDNEAKKTRTMRANWSYEDVETKVWALPNLTDFWGIGHRTAKRLNRLGISTVKELANANPDRLKEEFGVVGVQLWFHANGVDESNVHEVYKPKSSGLGNAQILPRDYTNQAEIELVLKEMAEQVAVRLRKKGKKTSRVSIYVGYSKIDRQQSIQAQTTLDPTASTRILAETVVQLFRSKYKGGAVRRIGVRYSRFVEDSVTVLSLFDDLDALDKEEDLQETIDGIREKFGFTSLQRANILTSGSRVKARSLLTGGHASGAAGGLDGLK